ncbi:hypothetical protein BBK82_47000 [Lentzea guizhouensis]|uniref:MalT-like TPR region domain-containing protein n=1 Tax=Lentzea guizhouensis TaxID=1586287 RepID=A0A1B2HXB0_9PSEU|nr:hypothetical protein BBK82_47000 [Lentzea guizhouensis]
MRLSLDLEDATAVAEAVRAAVPPPAGTTTAQRCLLGVVAEATLRGGGSADTAVGYARAALADTDAVTDWSMLSAATVLRVAGHPAEAMSVLDRAVEAFAHNGDSLARCRSLVQRALVHMSLGDLGRATQDASTAVRAVRDGGWSLPRAVVLLAWLSVQTGHLAKAGQLLDEVDAEQIRHRTPVYREYLRAAGWLAYLRDDVDHAVELMSACADEILATGLSDPGTLPTWTDIVHVLTLTGHDASGAVEEVDRLAKLWPSREAVAHSLLARGFATPGLAALDLLRLAAEGFAAVPSVVQQARAELQLGRRWLAAGRPAPPAGTCAPRSNWRCAPATGCSPTRPASCWSVPEGGCRRSRAGTDWPCSRRASAGSSSWPRPGRRTGPSPTTSSSRCGPSRCT